MSKMSPDMEEMRNLGRSMLDRGFFELDLMSGRITWVNDFALSKIGMSLDQVQTFTIFDLIHEEFHDILNGFILDATRGRTSKFYIWPNKTSDGSVIWWYFSKIKSNHPTHWFKAEYLNKTGTSGPEHASMCAAMNTANQYNDLFNRLIDFQDLTKVSMDLLNERYQELREEQEALKDQVTGAINAATKAANAAMEVSSSMRTFKEDVQKQLAEQTAEILRLISTDVSHDQRLAAFEAHIKATTDNAVRIIAVQANKAGEAITMQANQAGNKLSRKITIPVGTIAAIMTILQYIITHWPKK